MGSLLCIYLKRMHEVQRLISQPSATDPAKKLRYERNNKCFKNCAPEPVHLRPWIGENQDPVKNQTENQTDLSNQANRPSRANH